MYKFNKMVRGIGSFGESDSVLAREECSDCDSCEMMACPQEFLGRGVKTEKIENVQGGELSVILSKDRGDFL